MLTCFFASDLHGRVERYQALFRAIRIEKPRAVFLGGDLLPSDLVALFKATRHPQDFVNDFLVKELTALQEALGSSYPQIFLILGNDDARFHEATFLDVSARGLWRYVHNQRVALEAFPVYGYSYVPPTPFQLKDWERYDVSRYVDPGCVSPEAGTRTVPMSDSEKRFSTIQKDLNVLAGQDDLSKAVLLFHSPPYQTRLDRAALDGKMIDHVPLDVHIGSIAIQRFIRKRQPLLTLHGHVHESARLTGAWRDQMGETLMFSAAHDGPELALVRFDLENPASATRELI